MMDCPPMETIYQAISALYDNPNASEKEKASLWLGNVQKSIHSWKVADELLQQKKDVNSCYFAAQTMRSKVQHNLSELPLEAHSSLRDSLVSHLERTSPESTSAILTQLSLALADLALQMPSWQNCINDLIKSFSNKNDYALLEILTVLPQEIDSTNLKLGENRREDIKNELRSNAQIVTLFLKESITCSEDINVLHRVIKCMTSWLQVKAIDIQEVPQNAVICLCLQVLSDQNSANTLHDSASDCLCALLHCLEENNNNDNIERLLFDSISSLEESYHMAVAHEQEDKAANYARLFTELAETFLEKIIACTASGNPHFAMRSLELALVCVGHYDYEVAEITFNLWYRLSEEVYHRDYQPLTDTFKPHIERLLEALVRQCQFEPDDANLPEEGDEFYEFRSKVMVLIKDVVFIVGSSSVFRQMFVALHADISWEQTEAALFIMRSVAKNILPDEYEYVPKVVEAILSMPVTTHPGVRKTCIRLLGELCEWIERHHECLEPCLQFLINALGEPFISHVAAVALQDICRSCRAQASGHVSALAAAARNAPSLPPHTAALLMRALAAALGRLPADQVRVAMREAVGMQLGGLTEVVSGAGDGPPGKKGSAGDPVVWLDRIAALFRDVEVPPPTAGAQHPCLPAFADAWPVLKDVIDKWSGETRVMERTCRCVRFAVRCLGAAAGPLAAELCGTLQHAYTLRAGACSCVLYLCSVLVDELVASEGAVPVLVELLRALVPSALRLLQQPGALVDNPDTVDDLFRLCIRYLQRIPMAFLKSGAAGGALECAKLAARLDHNDANSSVMKFLYDFLRTANTTREDKRQIKEAAQSLLMEHGSELTFALVEASALRLHAYMLDEVAEVVVEVVVYQRANGVDWLQDALHRLPRDQPAAATTNQCWQFHQYLVRAEKCKEITRLLRDFAKLYR